MRDGRGVHGGSRAARQEAPAATMRRPAIRGGRITRGDGVSLGRPSSRVGEAESPPRLRDTSSTSRSPSHRAWPVAVPATLTARRAAVLQGEQRGQARAYGSLVMVGTTTAIPSPTPVPARLAPRIDALSCMHPE